MEELLISWQRASVQFNITYQQMQDERQRACANPNVPQEFIDKKDSQIEMLRSFYNQTDELFQAYRHALLQMRIENHFLNSFQNLPFYQI